MADFEAANGKGGRRREIKPTAFGTQANALLLKNIAYQKRNWQTNLCLVLMPVLMCVLLAVLQIGINAVLSGDQFKCGCQTVNGVKECGIQYSDGDQIPWCPIPSPPEFPAIMQVPPNEFRAVSSPGSIPGSSNFTDLPPPSCRNVLDGCPATILYTGQDRATAEGMGKTLLNTVPQTLVIAFKALSQSQGNQTAPSNGSSSNGTGQMPGNQTGSSKTPFYLTFFSEYTPGTAEYPPIVYLVEPAISLGGAGGWSGATEIELLQPTCAAFREVNSTNITLTITAAPNVPPFKLSVHCLDTLRLWRANSTVINNELYYGYNAGTNDSNEYSAAYDFQNTSRKAFNTLIWFNNTYRNSSGGQGSPPASVRFPRSMNLVANAFVKTFIDPLADIPLLFVKDFPKPGTSLSLDFSSLLGPLFYMWIMQLLFPVFTGSLVYEKEKNLRMMMKMHGLGDGPYWLISYAYFLIVSVIYMFFFIVIGSAINLKFFRINSYSIQIVFYFIFVNTQISLSVLASSVFGTVKTATVVCYLYVFGTGLLGEFLFRFFLTDENFPSWALVLLELVPAFSLYRGLYELSQSAFIGNYQGTSGTLTWSNLASSGVATVFLILAVEWLVFLLLGLYLDQVVASGSGVRKHPLFFLNCFFGGGKGGDGHHHRRFRLSIARGSTAARQVDVDVDRADVAQEREVVDRLVSSDGGLSQGYSIVCDSLRKVYPGRDGNAEKVAVKGMSVAISRGECFGMLGPNGAGKSTSIGMMIGFLRPSGGTAWIEGMDILEDMDAIYSAMGVCPQHDLLWEQLTGREHLLFYARLKNLKGKELNEAVEESLRSVNLWNGGVGNKPAGQYSGGMKRRLSVAISLIGDPLVVYMDEPSTGLDPASRMNLWNVVKAAKKDRGIVLTTHSMEEAEQLCDRLGIFVDGQFQCIGAPRELTARYGGTYVLTLTTPPHQEQQAIALARSLSPSAKQIYSIAGTQKFELPTSEVDVADVFAAVERAKQEGMLDVQAWGVANTTLEDVFIRIAKEAQAGVTSLS